MKKISDMEQIHNHNSPAVYGSGWPIRNGDTFREVLRNTLQAGFRVWEKHEIRELSREDHDTVRFKATLSRFLTSHSEPKPTEDTFKIEGIIQSYQVVVNSPDSHEPEFYSYIRVWWDKDES